MTLRKRLQLGSGIGCGTVREMICNMNEVITEKTKEFTEINHLLEGNVDLVETLSGVDNAEIDGEFEEVNLEADIEGEA